MILKILEFLDGKKAKIVAICGVIVGYLSATNVIDPKLATAILSILSIIAGGAAIATDKIYGARFRK